MSLARSLNTAPADEKAHLGRHELRVLYPHIRQHLPLALGAVGLLVVAQAAALAAPFLIRYGIDSGVRARDGGAVNLAAALLAVAAVVNWAALRASTVVGGTFGEKALRSLRMRTFEHLARLDLGFFERERAGRLVARLTSDVETIEVLVTEGLVQMSAQAMYLAGALVALVLLDPELGGASLAVVVPLAVVGTAIFRVRSERAYRRVRERIAAVLSFMQETVRGVVVVQAFTREKHNARAFRRVNTGWQEAHNDSFKPGAVFFPAVEMIGTLGTAVVLAFGGWRVVEGDLTVGILTAFVLYLATTLDPIQQLSQLYDSLQQALSGLAKLAGLLAQVPAIEEGSEPLNDVRGSAAAEGVTFTYGAGAPNALSDVRLHIQSGETLALVGPTGAGKSSIVKLLLRFYDPASGAITIDGQDLRGVKLASLREHMAMVPQEGFLFRGTIRDNVRFGRPEATDEEVENVCRLVGVDTAIRRLPAGYDTPVRERGAGLSGGERQLLALARALLADPKILVLDEATSALDGTTEAKVEQALHRASAGRTTIVIAHRLSTAAKADRVAVVDGGRIAELGTHAELVSRPDGLYSRLYGEWLAAGGTGSDTTDGRA